MKNKSESSEIPFPEGLKFFLGIIVLILIGSICVLSYHKREVKNDERFYTNIDVVVVSMKGNEVIELGSKHKTPTVIRSVLVRCLKDSTKYRQFNSHSNPVIDFSNQRWYNMDVGDTLHFDYLRKDRFFTIKK